MSFPQLHPIQSFLHLSKQIPSWISLYCCSLIRKCINCLEKANKWGYCHENCGAKYYSTRQSGHGLTATLAETSKKLQIKYAQNVEYTPAIQSMQRFLRGSSKNTKYKNWLQNTQFLSQCLVQLLVPPLTALPLGGSREFYLYLLLVSLLSLSLSLSSSHSPYHSNKMKINKLKNKKRIICVYVVELP